MYNTIKDTRILTRWAGEPYEETQGDGVIIDDSAGLDNVFHNNNIYNNEEDGMENQLVTTVDAECNWWGNVSGPFGVGGVGSGDPVQGDVDFVDWLLSPAPDGTCYSFASIIDSCMSVKNHGQFVSCIARKTNKLLRDGEITEKDAAAIIKWAARAYIF